MDTAGFLHALFDDLQPDEQINVRALASRSGRTTCNEFPESVDEAVDMIEGLNAQDEIYVGVNPRKNRDGKKSGVSRVNLYHADADDKLYGGDHEACLNAVVGYDLPPSLVEDSGHGFHCFWFLKQPLPVSQIPMAEEQMRRLYFALGGLDAVQNVDRILRVPGTWNNKDPRERKRVKVVYESGNTYTPEDFEAVLPALPRQEHREVAQVFEGEKPSVDFLRGLLAHCDPCAPQADYYLIWAAVAYYYPEQEGYDLIDEWSSDAREANGQSCSPRTDPAKHWRFKRQTGKVTTLGTLIHHATLGGWTPPERPLPVPVQSKRRAPTGIMAEIRRSREDKHLALLDELPNPGYDELPWMVQQFYDLVGTLADPFPRDVTTVLALTFLSNCWPRVRFENLMPNLWAMMMVEQGSGKNKLTDAMQDTIAQMPSVRACLYTSGTPEGMYTELERDGGDGNQLLCYMGEFGDFLISLSREHMRHARGVFCNLYDGRAVAHHLKKDTVRITNPYVTIVGTTTPRMIVDTLNQQDLWGGFASRFAYLAPPYQVRGYEGGPTRTAIKELAEIFDTHVLDLAHVREARWDRPRGVLPECYADYERECGVGTGEIRTFADALDDPKMPRGRDLARVKKFATNLALADREPMLDKDNAVVVPAHYAEMAVTLVRRTALNRDIVLAHVSSSEEEKALTAIQRVVDKSGTVGISRTAIMQQAHVKSGELKSLLPLLQESGNIEEHWVEDRLLWRSTDPTPLPNPGLRALKPTGD